MRFIRAPYILFLLRRAAGADVIKVKIYEFWIKKSSVKITRRKRSLLSRFIMLAIHFHFERKIRLSTIFLFCKCEERGVSSRMNTTSFEVALNTHSWT